MYHLGSRDLATTELIRQEEEAEELRRRNHHQQNGGGNIINQVCRMPVSHILALLCKSFYVSKKSIYFLQANGVLKVAMYGEFPITATTTAVTRTNQS